MLKKYACLYKNSQGRVFKEKPSQYRTPFQRDRDRIIHSRSFRRLEYKTQVFVNFESDHFRTRLTHSLEVAQISKALARKLYLDENLAEAISLAHDLGHPPFGHAGEKALNQAMTKFSGFDHNVQGFKILVKLDSPYAEYNGLNLTYETLDGLLKHNGPLTGKIAKIIKNYQENYNFNLDKYPSLEAQISALSDDIAYNNHDIDDGFAAQMLNEEDLKTIPFIARAIKQVNNKYKNLNNYRKLHEIRRILYSTMVDDVIRNTRNNLKKYQINNYLDVINSPVLLADFSIEMKEQIIMLKKLLYKKIYNHKKVAIMSCKAQKIVTDIFNFYFENPDCLGSKLNNDNIKELTQHQKAWIICDYIAGMTDRFAVKKHRELYQFSS
jgi:dGTPase